MGVLLNSLWDGHQAIPGYTKSMLHFVQFIKVKAFCIPWVTKQPLTRWVINLWTLCIQTGRVKFSERYPTGMRQTEREEYHSIIQSFERSVIYRVQKIKQREQYRKTYILGELCYRIYCTCKVLEFSSIFYRFKANSIRHQLLFSFRFVLFCFALSRGTFLKKRKKRL